jgi:Trypsin-like peptidase domain
MALTFTIDDGAIALVHFGAAGPAMGTAFAFLKPTWAVTAKHVAIEHGIPRTNLHVQAYKRPAVAAKVLFAHREVDLAILELASPVCRRPLYPGHHSMASADGLVFAGFNPTRTASTGVPLILVSLITSYAVEERERDTCVEETVVFHAPESEGGNSGGPILGTTGAVVGVVIDNFTRDTGLHARGTGLQPLLDRLTFTQNGRRPRRRTRRDSN